MCSIMMVLLAYKEVLFRTIQWPGTTPFLAGFDLDEMAFGWIGRKFCIYFRR
jgi:hypothetical protein